MADPDGMSQEERDLIRRLREIPDPTEEEIGKIPPLSGESAQGPPGPGVGEGEEQPPDSVRVGDRDIPLDIREGDLQQEGESEGKQDQILDVLRQILIEIQDLPDDMADAFGVDQG